MHKVKQYKALLIPVLSLFIIMMGCKQQKTANVPEVEDKVAKEMLQGVWENEEDGTPVFKISGDTITYPDSTSLPVTFKVIADMLVINAADPVKYPILKQTENLFCFKNQYGEQVTLIKSSDPEIKSEFSEKLPVMINQNKLIKTDTIFTYQENKYHCYVQINPTTYKVIKTSYNDEGMSMQTIYYDNIINLNIYHGAQKVFSRDFRKSDFSGLIPPEYMKQGILNDMKFKKVSKDGISYDAFIGIPDNPGSYVVEIQVSFNGKLSMMSE